MRYLASVEDRFRRLINKYPEVYKGKSLDISVLKSVYESIGEYSNFKAVIYQKDILQYAITALIMKYGKYPDLNLMNAYELIDIYLGHSEYYSCISEIRSDLVVIYDGYGGIPNKQKGNMIVQLIEQQRMKGKKFWFLYKGTSKDLKSTYPEVYEILEENKFDIVEPSVYNSSKKVRTITVQEGDEDF